MKTKKKIIIIIVKKEIKLKRDSNPWGFGISISYRFGVSIVCKENI